MIISHSSTARGFAFFEFKDRYDQECSIQESSLATEAAIWFGVDVDVDGNKPNARMHLTQDQVASLLPILQYFAENGELPQYAEDGAIPETPENSEADDGE